MRRFLPALTAALMIGMPGLTGCADLFYELSDELDEIGRNLDDDNDEEDDLEDFLDDLFDDDD